MRRSMLVFGVIVVLVLVIVFWVVFPPQACEPGMIWSVDEYACIPGVKP